MCILQGFRLLFVFYCHPDSVAFLGVVFRLVPILVNGMKYSEIDLILLKVK